MIPIQDTGLMLHPWPPNVLVRPNLQWDEGADSPEVWGVGVVTGCGVRGAVLLACHRLTVNRHSLASLTSAFYKC